MKQAAQEAFENNLDRYEKMRAGAKTYVNKRECSVQEAVHHSLPEIPLQKVFLDVSVENADLRAYKITYKLRLIWVGSLGVR